MRPPEPRLPLAPLLTGGRTIGDIAALLGVSKRVVSRWRHDGIRWSLADQAAVALGLHPALVWPDWYEAVAS